MGYQMDWMLAQPLEKYFENDMMVQDSVMIQDHVVGYQMGKDDGLVEGIQVGNDVGSRDELSAGLDVGLAVGEVLGK